MSLNFPDAPSVNDEYSAEGRTWTWDGTVWLANETSVSVLSVEEPLIYDTDTDQISIDLSAYDNSLQVDDKIAAGIESAPNGLSGFQIFVGDEGYTTFTLEEEQPAGEYYITSRVAGDYTYDVYVSSASGVFSGYTTSRFLTATDLVKYVVIYGATANDNILFNYKPVATGEASGNVNGGVGPFAISVDVETLPNIGDTTTVTGGNFADNAFAIFTGSDLLERVSASVVKNSASEIVVTRPEDLPPEYEPYTLTVRNPGIPDPTDGRNIINDVIYSGGYPIWNTTSSIYWTLGESTSLSLSAGDPDASDIDYYIVSGSLFNDFSIDNETGVITGNDSALTEGDSTTFVVRAEDEGGNNTLKEITLFANQIVQWVTPEGALEDVNALGSNTIQLEHSDGGIATDVVYSLETGLLPLGIELLSDRGQIIGTPVEEGVFVFTLGITDNGGITNLREFSLTTSSEIYSWYFDPFASASKSPIALLNNYSL
jgi:hypothetical protein